MNAAEKLFVLIGPPGTGKTQSLTQWLAKQVGIFGARQVVACSFTRAAAIELAGRNAVLPRENIGTLHSFAYRALGCPRLVVKHVTAWNDEHKQMRFSTRGTPQDPDTPFEAEQEEQAHGDRLLAEVTRLRNRCTPCTEWPESLQRFATTWTDFKAQHDCLDFTDLIAVCLRDVDTFPQRPLVACLDEAQDSTKLQLDLFLKWALETHKAVLAGDPQQCLYEWCGTDPTQLAMLYQSLPSLRTKVLSQSYRVPANLHAIAEGWIGRTRLRLSRPYQARELAGGGVFRHEPTATWKQPHVICAEAARLQEQGKRVMILATCAAFLVPTLRYLREHAIPFGNLHRPSRLDWNPLLRGTRHRQFPLDKLLAFLRPAPLLYGTGARYWTRAEFACWASCLDVKKALVGGGRETLKQLRSDTSAASLSDLLGVLPRELVVQLDDFDFTQAPDVLRSVLWWLGLCTASWKRTLAYVVDLLRAQLARPNTPSRVLLQDFLEPPKLVEAADVPRSEVSVFPEKPLLCVGTGHSVKGGEAEHVFIFPDLSPAAMTEWMGLNKDTVRRLFYVMLTRARTDVVWCDAVSERAVSIGDVRRISVMRE